MSVSATGSGEYDLSTSSGPGDVLDVESPSLPVEAADVDGMEDDELDESVEK